VAEISARHTRRVLLIFVDLGAATRTWKFFHLGPLHWL
jgi:hypothetical protein